MKCKVKAHKLKDVRFDDWHTEVHNNWVFDDFHKPENKRYVSGWVSFDCLLLDKKKDLFCPLFLILIFEPLVLN